MKSILKTTLTLAITFYALPVLALEEGDNSPAKSIYGADNRIELYNAAPDTFKMSDSVVSLWKAPDVQIDAAAKTATLVTKKFADELGLCPGEKFREQPIGAFCSGSLVGPDLIMTAGHCVKDLAGCEGTKIVFGFAIQKAGGSPTTKMAQSEVYTCKKIVTRFLGGEPGSVNPAGQNLGPDYALIQLDRKVTGHKPLPIARTDVKKGDKLMVIGHPVGLPLKIAAGSSVRDASKIGYFVADLDTFGGNSGSPVFDTATKLVVGILVRGDTDFIQSPAGCVTMATYAQTGGRGEDVTKISALGSFIPKLASKAEKDSFQDMSLDGVSTDGIGQRINVNFQ